MTYLPFIRTANRVHPYCPLTLSGRLLRNPKALVRVQRKRVDQPYSGPQLQSGHPPIMRGCTSRPRDPRARASAPRSQRRDTPLMRDLGHGCRSMNCESWLEPKNSRIAADTGSLDQIVRIRFSPPPGVAPHRSLELTTRTELFSAVADRSPRRLPRLSGRRSRLAIRRSPDFITAMMSSFDSGRSVSSLRPHAGLNFILPLGINRSVPRRKKVPNTS